MNKLPNKELLRVDEVAKYFRVSSRTVYRWIGDNSLEIVRIPGKSIRIIYESVENVIRCHKMSQ